MKIFMFDQFQRTKMYTDWCMNWEVFDSIFVFISNKIIRGMRYVDLYSVKKVFWRIVAYLYLAVRFNLLKYIQRLRTNKISQYVLFFGVDESEMFLRVNFSEKYSYLIL